MPRVNKVTHCIFVIFVFIFHKSTGYYSGDIFCFHPLQDKCVQTRLTYGMTCFTSAESCQKFIKLPDNLWYLNSEKLKCFALKQQNSRANIYFTSEQACRKFQNRLRKDLGNSGTEAAKNISIQISKLHYAYIESKKGCFIKKTRIPTKDRYSAYRVCKMDNRVRSCFDEKTKQCVVLSQKRTPHRYCFATKRDCFIYSRWTSELWYRKNGVCHRTLPALKKPSVRYFKSNIQCTGICYELGEDGTCAATKKYEKCNFVKGVFLTMDQCLQCKRNKMNGVYYVMSEKGCVETDLMHSFLYVHCSKDQCDFRKRLNFYAYSVEETGLRYSMDHRCTEVHDIGYNEIHSFKTYDECMKAYTEDQQLRKNSVKITRYHGVCMETMNLSLPNLYETREECNKIVTDGSRRYYRIINGSVCEHVLVNENNKDMANRWYHSYEECRRFVKYHYNKQPETPPQSVH